MCQITVTNLHDERLNKKLFLLLGTLGSEVHNDGWGISSNDARIFKCPMPMYWTSNSGKILNGISLEKNSTLIGHIRQASPQVPVTEENAHPFKSGEISMVHNGKLTPKDDKDFDIEYEVQSRDKDGNLEYDKDGKPKMTKFKRSDSLIFFEKFMEIWNKTDIKEQDAKFLRVLQETMSLFFGKFALVFSIQGTVYVVRGKTADLGIIYLRTSSRENAKNIGWAINTDKKNLDTCTLLLSNLEQLEGKPSLYFSVPVPLETEAVYVVENVGLRKLGEVKENPFPASQTYLHNREWRNGSAENPTIRTGTSSSVTSKVQEYAKEIYKFMSDYFLYPSDIENIFLALYSCSMSEVTTITLKHFVDKAIPSMKNFTTKDIRKAIKRHIPVPLGLHVYNSEMQYPWFFNTREGQSKFINKNKKSK
jgi:predicted glutamine amidotransferase